MNALILVDIQNDFVPGGALPVPKGDEIVSLVNRLQPHFDLVVATQDWHPADHGSFAANHPGRKVGEVIELQDMPQILWPVHCVENTPGADFVAGLDAQLTQTDGGRQAGGAATDDDDVELHCFSFHDSLLRIRA